MPTDLMRALKIAKRDGPLRPEALRLGERGGANLASVAMQKWAVGWIVSAPRTNCLIGRLCPPPGRMHPRLRLQAGSALLAGRARLEIDGYFCPSVKLGGSVLRLGRGGIPERWTRHARERHQQLPRGLNPSGIAEIVQVARFGLTR
jgi:hypothetical protein